MEEAEKRRQAMTQKLTKNGENCGPDIKKTLCDVSSYDTTTLRKGLFTFEISREAKREKVKTKEEQQEEKRIALSIRIKSLDLDGIKTAFFVKI